MAEGRARCAGILLHPTSLPSPYGRGDIGHAAYRFVEFLSRAGFGLWQMLPVVPPHRDLSPYDALSAFAGNPALGWGFFAIRTLGRSLVVPAIEEIFYRGFVYRYVISPNFTEVALNRFHAGAFALTSVMFGIAHGDHWIQGVLCGAAYQWLVLRKSRLGDAMLAHAITNLIISIYAVVTNQWQFT